ncbi:MAG: DMT family transporter [Rhodobiaceae bacterium]|nr:DMT family transporter [Rhodobiaceae bacterium]
MAESGRVGRWVRSRHSGLSDNMQGILAMTAASMFFITNDSTVKVVGASLPVPQIVFLRGAIAAVLILIVARHLGHLKPIPRPAWGKLTIRTLAEISCTLLYLTSLMHMPIPNSTAILQTAPLFLTIYAALIIKEGVGWRRWSAVIFGFIGMLLIVKPGTDGFNAYAVLAIVAALMVTTRDLLTRVMPHDIPAITITLITMAGLSAAGGVLTLATGEWAPVSLRDALLICLSAGVLTIGFICVITAMRKGEVSVVTPYRYTILIGALFYGYVLFGEVPDMLSGLGILLIVGSNLYVFARERRKRIVRPQ